MNKTISINIGGFVFNIEEDAYQKLYHYLNTIKKNFTSEEEREEIMHDIELRIAEIFQACLSASKQVIMDKDIEQMIEIMGRPEDYVSDEFNAESDKKSSSKSDSNFQNTSSKRLFRDPENETLGGVCAGLAHYTNLDVAIVRLIFVLMTILGGSGILIYVILWIVIPEAKSTNDKLQMKGQSINIESIKEHFINIKNDIKEKASNGKFRKSVNETFDKGVEVGSSAVKALSKIIGGIFILGGSFALIFLFVVLFGDTGLLPLAGTEHAENLGTMLDILYPGTMQSSLVFLAILVVTLIPIISIIITGTKVLFNIKQRFKTIAITATIIWFAAAGTLVITGINLGMSMRAHTGVEYNLPMTDSSNVLLIDVADDQIFSNHLEYDDVWNHTELIRLKDDRIYLGYPELFLTEKGDSGNFEIIVHKTSNGLSNKDAIGKSENIEYPVSINHNKLLLNPYFSVPITDKLRNQKVQVEVRIPLGKEVKLGNGIDRIEFRAVGKNRYDENSCANTTWKPAFRRVICVECKESREMHLP
ncbi:MAG: PspC domain-containing protein [Crocinitomicaceae bacterium]|nr:PspC domain-containing protein [Crocinitomicaceae bacterium]